MFTVDHSLWENELMSAHDCNEFTVTTRGLPYGVSHTTGKIS